MKKHNKGYSYRTDDNYYSKNPQNQGFYDSYYQLDNKRSHNNNDNRYYGQYGESFHYNQ